MIPYGRQDIRQSDIDAVIKVLKSEYLTQGPMVPAFEKQISQLTTASYSVAANSATSALHLACMAINLGPDDIFWTSPITFAASANCGLYCGAKVDFVDIDPVTYNICVRRLAEKLAEAEKKGCLPKLVIPVHLSGEPCDMKEIYELSLQYGFAIIEDASHAIGASYKETLIGSSCYSDITVFSFHPVKIITTAEGGVAVTNNAALAEKMKLYRSHGITRDQKLMEQQDSGPWYYEQLELGFNYRMTELQAALGITQLERLSEYIEKRHSLADFYDKSLKGLPLHTPFRSAQNFSSLHLYIVRLKLDQLNKSHKQIFSEMREAGIGVNLHYIPVHLHPYYQRLGFRNGDFPNAEKYYAEAISLPLYPGLNDEAQGTVIKCLQTILK